MVWLSLIFRKAALISSCVWFDLADMSGNEVVICGYCSCQGGFGGYGGEGILLGLSGSRVVRSSSVLTRKDLFRKDVHFAWFILSLVLKRS